MASTPKAKTRTLSCKREGSSSSNNNLLSSTPTSESKSIFCEENEDSPVFMTCTQEAKDDLDVVWDWNSPQSKNKSKIKQKRLMLPQSSSPKFTFKRHASNNKINDFDKIREELQALREQIAAPDNEDCLILSPLDEERFKKEPEEHFVEEEIFPSLKIDNRSLDDDPFGDDDIFANEIEEQLLKLTQKVEQEHKVKNKTDNDTNKLLNDSLDGILGGLDDDKLIQLSQKTETKNKQFEFKKMEKTTGKVEFHRTQSFEMAVSQSDIVLPDHVLQEIERKRKEALAKIERKQRENKQISDTSPRNCTPAEIEQKRLQAIAKRNAKRQQEIIEQKRQEALRKLQLNRLKQQSVIKRL